MQGKSILTLRKRTAAPDVPATDEGHLYVAGSPLGLFMERSDGSIIDFSGAGGVFVPARDWGAVPGAGDVTTEIQDALDNCPVGATLVFEPGTYTFSDTLVLDNAINIIAAGATFDLGSSVPTGTIPVGVPENHNGTSYLSIAAREAGTLFDKVAFYVKGSGGARLYRNFIRGLKVTRTASDNKMGSRLHLGIVFEGPFECFFEDIYAENFFGGIVCTGINAGGGFAYNVCSRFSSASCRYGLTLYTFGSGWVNQNLFTGGRLWINSDVRGDIEWDGDLVPANGHWGWEWEYIRLLWHSASSYGGPNANEFQNTSLEGEVGRKIRVESSDNFFKTCRYEDHRTHTPLYDITIGEASRTVANFSRNRFDQGHNFHNVIGNGQLEFLGTFSGRNYGNSFISQGVAINSHRGGWVNENPHVFRNVYLDDTWPVAEFSDVDGYGGVTLWAHYSSLSAGGAISFHDATAGTKRGAIACQTASPYDLITDLGLNIAGVFRARKSGSDALLANPISAGKWIYNVGTGTFDLYSGSSANNDVLRILDAGQDERIILKGGSADWGAGHYGVIEFWEESVSGSPTRENAIYLLSTAFGAARPVTVHGPAYFNKGALSCFGRFRGSGIASLMEWDAVNDRVGINTTAPDTQFHNNGASHLGGDTEIDGALNHDGTTVGLYGATPVAQVTGFTMTNKTEDKTLDCDSTTLDEVADVLATLVDTLKGMGIIG